MKTTFTLILLFIVFAGYAQNGNKSIAESFEEVTTKNSAVSYFEVTKEMFQMLSESKEVGTEYKNYVSKLSGLKMIQCSGTTQYKTFVSSVNLDGYSRLMTQKEGWKVMSFYKKEGKNENEFLLLSTEMIIYITGTIDLKSLGEFEQVMEVAGSAFDM